MTKKRKTKIIKCSICGREFETSYSDGAIRCSECSKNKPPRLNAPIRAIRFLLVCKYFSEGMTVKRIANLKKLKQIIFLLTVLAMFLIAGGMDCGEISFGAAMAASAVNFILMAWSGFSSGLLAVSDKKENLTILNRKIKNISPEKRQELFEMARTMFNEDFGE